MKKYLVSALLLSATMASQAAEPTGVSGKLSRSLWYDLTTDHGLESLFHDPLFYQTPNVQELVNSLDSPSAIGKEYYGQRYRGYIVAPVTGEYNFWLAGDNYTGLWLGTSDDKFSKVQEIAFSHWTIPNEFGKYREQASRSISLVAGQRYYLETLHKEAFGGNHVSVSWSFAENEGLTNWCLEPGVTASQISTQGSQVASKAIDGNISGKLADDSISRTASQPWAYWEVDLGADRQIDRLEIFNHDLDGESVAAQLKNYNVHIYDSSGNVMKHRLFHDSGNTRTRAVELWETGGVVGSRVRITQSGGTHRYLNLAEVRVLGRADPSNAYQPQALLSGSALQSYAGSLNDQDGDELPDDWETTHGFNPSVLEAGQFAPYADPDQDGFSSYLEGLAGTDPFTPDSFPGFLTVDTWDDVLGSNVTDLYSSGKYYQEPDATRPLPGTSLLNVSVLAGHRLRGYLTAPTTGTYHFWLSARDGAEFWLSTDSSKYAKRRLAVMGLEAGTGDGVWSSYGNDFDRFASQMTEGIELTAGQTYFFEVLNQRTESWGANLSVAWAPPGSDRELLPASAVSSYFRQSEDADDDYLPDAWETTHGLNPLDNGATDREREGENGDFDSDGLSNREEYLAGTNPASGDTDGDGLTDLLEISSYGTDPTQSDAPFEALVSSVDLGTYQNASSPWLETSMGLISESFRGEISWPFDVPSPGVWSINIATQLLGDLTIDETLPVEVLINGASLGDHLIEYGAGRAGTIRVISPQLIAGNHLLTLKVKNLYSRRSLNVLSIDILQPGGADLDNDGQPDWIYTKLVGENAIAPYQPTSRVSPAFLEGKGRFGALVNGSTTEMGLDARHWFTNLPLQETGPTSFTASFESGLVTESGSISWIATNVLATNPVLTIRQDDTLKLTAVPSGGPTGQSVTFTTPGQTNHALDPAAVATQSSTPFAPAGASNAIDGETYGPADDQSTRTNHEDGAWWQVDLGVQRSIDRIVIWNKKHNNWQLANFRISVYNDAGTEVTFRDFYTSGQWGEYVKTKDDWYLGGFYDARIVKVHRLGESFGTNRLEIAEVQVFGVAAEVLPDDNDALLFQFTQPGTQEIMATHSDGTVGTLTVEVKKATFGTTKDLVVNTVSDLSFPSADVDADLFFDGGDFVTIDQDETFVGDDFRLSVKPRFPGEINLLARLSPTGPVLAVQPVNLISVGDPIQSGLIESSFDQAFPNHLFIRSGTVVTGLPDGGFIRVTLFRAGITWLDGTDAPRQFTAADLENGILNLELLYPKDLPGAFCHRIEIFDRDGNFLRIF